MVESDTSLIRLENVCKFFGPVKAVNDISITIDEGELVTFVGPSGCGKTTLLRTIAGFHKPTSGEVYLDGKRITELPPEERETGMVFQNYALFPHMTVFENVAYGLKLKKLSKNDIKKRAEEALAQVRLDGYGDRKPSELSGGQQQRVAIARSLVLRPKVLLLDEPLSNLDANLRIIMRDEIRRLKEDLNLTIIFVTHDQEEALSISDRVMVLKDGMLQQLAQPEVVYQKPANEFVANFIGYANLIEGEIVKRADENVFVSEDLTFRVNGMKENDRGLALIRPEMIQPREDGLVEGTVMNRTYNGNSIRYEVQIGETTLLVDDYDVSSKKVYHRNEKIRLSIPDRVHFIAN